MTCFIHLIYNIFRRFCFLIAIEIDSISFSPFPNEFPRKLVNIMALLIVTSTFSTQVLSFTPLTDPQEEYKNLHDNIQKSTNLFQHDYHSNLNCSKPHFEFLCCLYIVPNRTKNYFHFMFNPDQISRTTDYKYLGSQNLNERQMFIIIDKYILTIEQYIPYQNVHSLVGLSKAIQVFSIVEAQTSLFKTIEIQRARLHYETTLKNNEKEIEMLRQAIKDKDDLIENQNRTIKLSLNEIENLTAIKKVQESQIKELRSDKGLRSKNIYKLTSLVFGAIFGLELLVIVGWYACMRIRRKIDKNTKPADNMPHEYLYELEYIPQYHYDINF